MMTQLFAALAFALLLVGPSPSAARPAAGERETIDKTFTLSPGARVEVSSISGSVVVETTNSATAEVHVVRTAGSRAELDCAPMLVEGSPTSLVVRTQRESGCRGGHHTDEVHLLLPASVDFRASSVSGSVTVGAIDGPVRLSSVSGNVRVGGARGALDVESVSGDVTVDRVTGGASITSVSGSIVLEVAELGDRGITVDSLSGDLEVRFAGAADADVTVESVSGRVTTDLADMRLTKLSGSSFRGQLGSGGGRIALSSISGSVRFTRR